ncbi:MAG: TonB family protein [Acidobacteriota bacterium]|nr:TonB family protein [Acidobacteriota bacterium]
MFETATFESTGRITTQSRKWMVVTLLFNGSILAALIVTPLLRPELLPGRPWISLLTPPMVPSAPPVTHAPAETARTVQLGDPYAAPRTISTTIPTDPGPAPAQVIDPTGLGNRNVTTPGAENIFGPPVPVHVTHPPVATGPVHVSSGVLDGRLIFKRNPTYPPIAISAGIQGTVKLQAVISKTGKIENLRVISGLAMLRQAAIDAVSQWRYQPYILNGQPVEVETTVNVVFNLSH